tara:strand:- start:166 stop:729 length:564 start_codon:yes stop_codon:yes gene_type:complete
MKNKKINITNLIYIAIMVIAIALGTGCSKEQQVPAAKYTRSYSSLDELFNNNFHCYRVQYLDSNTYHFNTSVNNEFLAAWNSPPSEFDLNDDQQVNTQDMLLVYFNFGNPQPEYPMFLDFTPYQTFGEGNTWLTYTGSDPAISFGWMHRTPYDETNEVTYSGYEDIYTWTLDVVTEDETIVYYFVEI